MSRRQGRTAEYASGRPDADGRRIVERLIEKKQFKDALKQAKLAFRQNQSPENRQLLQRTSCLRAEELARRGLLAEAKEVIDKARDLGVLDSAAIESLALRAPQVGLDPNSAGAALAPATSARSDAPTASQVDRAVLRPEEISAALPEESRLAIARVRSALAALEADDESQALEFLQDIPRGSPLADWRYFVRGLAAFHRGAGEQAIANWDRLAADRPAFAIAKLLKRALPLSAGDYATGLGDVSLIEVALFSEPVLGRLERLHAAIEEQGWGQVIKLMSSLTVSLRRADVRLARRLTEAMLEPLAKEATKRSFERARRLVSDFTRVAEPLPLDPHWNRFWALLWERTEDEYTGAIEHWRLYIQDLDRIALPFPVERGRLQALVWRHIGELLLKTPPNDEFGPPRRRLKRGEPDDRLDRANAALRRSLKLDPTQLATHNLLIKSCLDGNQPQQAADAARNLLQAFPENMSALQTLIDHHFAQDEPAESLVYLRRAQALKPLDESLIAREWSAHVMLARQHAIAKRWDEGRAEFAAAEALPVLRNPPHWMLVRKVAFEFKANQPARAEELLREAQTTLEEPTVLWLLVMIEAARFKAPKAIAARFQDQWRTALGKKKTSQTAGLIAGSLAAYLEAKTDIPNRDRVLEEAIGYMAKTTRIKYREADLAAVCTFLAGFEDEALLTEKLTRRGMKQFPRAAIFPYRMAQCEIGKGPMACDLRQAKRLLTKSLQLAQAPEADWASLVPAIQQQLLQLDDVEGAMDRLPFGSGAVPAFQQMIDAFLNGEFNGDDDPDDAPDEFPFGLPRRRPRPAGRGKRR